MPRRHVQATDMQAHHMTVDAGLFVILAGQILDCDRGRAVGSVPQSDARLTMVQELTILGVLLLTSKGAAGVTGSGFITLAATLSTIPTIPVAGLALILGIDRFMSEARALTNIIGNGVATVVAAKWENELDVKQMGAALDPKAVKNED